MNSREVFEPIIAATCEELAKNKSLLPLVPEFADTFNQFLVRDPFGIRKAIVPVFLEDSSGIYGMGTAFHVDGWGTFLSAAHIIHEARIKRPMKQPDIQAGWIKPELFEKRFFLLLGQGLAYGGGSGALAPVDRGYLVLNNSDKPLSDELESLADIAALQLSPLPPPTMISTLPVRLSGALPLPGETVLAVGFPELACQPIDDINYFVSEGMYGAYGLVIKLHPKGMGAYGTNPTPVIEVETNWRNGMSGGPVFNQRGDVIGIVSRGIGPDCENTGHESVPCFALMPWLRRFLPTVDPSNPGMRKGWAVIKFKPKHLAGFFPSEEAALSCAKSLGTDYQVIYGSNRIATDDFVF
jgi:serine protease Do